MLARIQGIVGPVPPWMLEGEEAPKYFTPEGCVYQRMDDDSCKRERREREAFLQHGCLVRLLAPSSFRLGIPAAPPFILFFLSRPASIDQAWTPLRWGRPASTAPAQGTTRVVPPPPDGSPAARYALIHPKKTSLKRRLRVEDDVFLDFVEKLLSVDPTCRCVKNLSRK